MKKEKYPILSLYNLVLLLLLFASCNVINRFYYFLFVAFGIFVLTLGTELSTNFPVVWLILLAFSWVMFAPDAMDALFSPIKPFTYLLCFVTGYNFFKFAEKSNNNQAEQYKYFHTLLSVISIGMIIHWCLNWFTARSQGTVLSASDRNTVDFWTKGVMAATGQASIACIPLGVSIACIFAKTGRKIKFLALSMLLIIIGYNLVLSGRTLFIMMIICASIVYLYGLFFKKSNRVKSTVTIAAVIILVLLAYRSNLLGIRSYIESTPFYDRFFAEDAVMELEEDGRMERKLFYLEKFWEYPWGGVHLRNFVGYSHDIYLDTYDEAGIFAFIAVFCYMLSTVFRLFKCITSKSIPFQTRQLVLCIYVCIYIEFMVEPILQGMPWLFASFCLIDGYVSRILKHNKIATENGVMVR